MPRISFFTLSPSLWLVVTVYAFTPTFCRPGGGGGGGVPTGSTPTLPLRRGWLQQHHSLVSRIMTSKMARMAAHPQPNDEAASTFAAATTAPSSSSSSHALDVYPAIVATASCATNESNDDDDKKKEQKKKKKKKKHSKQIEQDDDPMELYRTQHAASIADPATFWKKQAHKMLHWDQDFGNNVLHGSLRQGDVSWFNGGKLNVCYNAVDRHVFSNNKSGNTSARADKTALLWEGDEPGQVRRISYRQLLSRVSQIAHALRAQGVQRGDVVTIYMPMIPELCMTMLACARIGAVHSVIFAGFSSQAVAARIVAAHSKVVVTAKVGKRGGKTIPLLQIVTDAMELHDAQNVVEKILVWDRDACCRQSDDDDDDDDEAKTARAATTPSDDEKKEEEEEEEEEKVTEDNNNYKDTKFIDMNALVNRQRPYCPPESMDSEDNLFILYTSGSTGQPKGLVHTTGGYAVYAAFTTRTTFDLKKGDDDDDENDNDEVFACVADLGWITGHTYITYGPLLNGCTTLLFESTPVYPHAGRYWDMIDRHKITHFYTAPTSIRLLMRFGDDIPHQYDLSSLKVLGSVGEPINPAAWKWYYEHIGRNACTVVDTYWQTETGGHMATNLPGITPMIPGSCTLPLYGIDFAVLNPVTGQEILPSDEPSPDDDDDPSVQTGVLAIRQPWPGMARTCLNDHERFKTVYLKPYPGYYFTGDSVLRLRSNGYHFITGRVDDVLNISGHRIGTAEVESALVLHPAVAQAAVVGKAHPIKGQSIVAFVMLTVGYLNQHDDIDKNHDELIQELRNQVRKSVGAFASPDEIFVSPSFPVTRSGKIMRRILRKIVAGETDTLGDTSTLADPSIVNLLIEKVEAAAADAVEQK